MKHLLGHVSGRTACGLRTANGRETATVVTEVTCLGCRGTWFAAEVERLGWGAAWITVVGENPPPLDASLEECVVRYCALLAAVDRDGKPADPPNGEFDFCAPVTRTEPLMGPRR